jgi:hypothetical protein
MGWMSKTYLVKHSCSFVGFLDRDFLQPEVLCHSNNASSILGAGRSDSLLMERISKISTSMPNWVTSVEWYCQGKLIVLLYSSIMTSFFSRNRIILSLEAYNFWLLTILTTNFFYISTISQAFEDGVLAKSQCEREFM